ncbi:MAG: Uma2 family endonuclease, partial [Planctomycetes bacterium]|nr:Uma2 family endonuclease [Planctomycetota bacterium]
TSKPEVYRRLGVREYFLYDPTADYLKPPLRGFRLAGDAYCPIEPDATGALISEELDLLLRLEGRDLWLFDRGSGERLLTEVEAGRAALEAERGAREAERAAREAAEAEAAHLRKLLRERGAFPDDDDRDAAPP